MSKFRSAAPLLFMAAAFFSPGAAQAQSAAKPHSLGIDDVLAIKTVDDARISPEGNWVAYTVTENDLDEDEPRSRIFMAAVSGGEVVALTGPDYSASSPRWSPDGKYLAFLAAKSPGDDEDDAKTQVWTLDRRGGEAQPYTDVAQGVTSFAWSPDGGRMLLVIKDQSEIEKRAEEAKEKGEEPKPEPWVIDRLEFKEDYVGYLDRSRTHLYLQGGPGAEPVQITFGDYDDRDPVWSPDGDRIAFVSNRTEEPDRNQNSDIWIVPADGKDKRPKLLQVTTNPGSDYAPAWSGDGASLAYVTTLDVKKLWYATSHLAVVPAAGGEPRVLTRALDRNVIAPKFSADGGAVLFVLEDSGAQHLARIDLASGELTRPIGSDVAVQSFDRHKNGAVAALITGPHSPPEVFLLKDGALAQVTHANTELMQSLRLAEVRNIHYSSGDGTEIEGFVFLPPGYRKGKAYPTLLRIHGGPVSQFDFGFYNDAQLFAAHGYVVVTVNPRGSSGYGEDFALAIFADWGAKDSEDVMAGVDYAIAQGYADPDRLGVGGWSYGGILTNYVITKTDRFKGAVSGASEVLYIANYGHDIYQNLWEEELGLPWENREAWERISPFNNVTKITTPTLIMGGKEDWNVPILNSEQLYQALRRLGVTTQLVVYPGEFHGFKRPSFIRDRYQRYLDWYDTYVKGK